MFSAAAEPGPALDALLSGTQDVEARRAVCRDLLGAIRAAGVPTVERRYEAGDLVCGEDEQGGALQIVSDGVVRLSTTRHGSRDTVLRLVGPWEPAGVPALAPSLPRLARAEAFTPCGVAKVPRVFVERAVRTSPGVALGLAAVLETELSRREELHQCLLPRNTEARLARLLPILAREFGEYSDGRVVIGLRITHYDLAAMVASTRESVTAAVGAMRRQGLVEKRAGTVTILNPEGLAKISDLW